MTWAWMKSMLLCCPCSCSSFPLEFPTMPTLSHPVSLLSSLTQENPTSLGDHHCSSSSHSPLHCSPLVCSTELLILKMGSWGSRFYTEKRLRIFFLLRKGIKGLKYTGKTSFIRRVFTEVVTEVSMLRAQVRDQGLQMHGVEK